MQKLEKYQEAETLFQSLCYAEEPSENDLHVQRAAMQRLELLKGEVVVAKLEEALVKIAATDEGITEYELEMAETVLKDAVKEYSGSDDTFVSEKVTAFANERLEAIQKQRSGLSDGNATESDSDSNESLRP